MHTLFTAAMISEPQLSSRISKLPGSLNSFLIRTQQNNLHVQAVTSLAHAVEMGGIYVCLRSNPRVGLVMLGANARHLAESIGRPLSFAAELEACGVPKQSRSLWGQITPAGVEPFTLHDTIGSYKAHQIRWHVAFKEAVIPNELLVFGVPSTASRGFGIFGMSGTVSHPLVRFAGWKENMDANLESCAIRSGSGAAALTDYLTVVAYAGTGLSTRQVAHNVLSRAIAVSGSDMKNQAIKASNEILLMSEEDGGFSPTTEIYSHIVLHKRSAGVYVGEGPRQVFLESDATAASGMSDLHDAVNSGGGWVVFNQGSKNGSYYPTIAEKLVNSNDLLRATRLANHSSRGRTSSVSGGAQGMNLYSPGPAFAHANGLGDLPMCFYPWVTSSGGQRRFTGGISYNTPAKIRAFVAPDGVLRPASDLTDPVSAEHSITIQSVTTYFNLSVGGSEQDFFRNNIAQEPSSFFLSNVTYTGIPSQIGDSMTGPEVLRAVWPSMFYAFAGTFSPPATAVGYVLEKPDFSPAARVSVADIGEIPIPADVDAWAQNGVWPGSKPGGSGRGGLLYRAVDLPATSFTQVGLKAAELFDEKMDKYT